jgi:hypothetical protein
MSSTKSTKRLTIKEDSSDVVKLTEIDPKLVGRLARGKNVKRYIVYPEDFFRLAWDLITTL